MKPTPQDGAAPAPTPLIELQKAARAAAEFNVDWICSYLRLNTILDANLLKSNWDAMAAYCLAAPLESPRPTTAPSLEMDDEVRSGLRLILRSFMYTEGGVIGPAKKWIEQVLATPPRRVGFLLAQLRDVLTELATRERQASYGLSMVEEITNFLDRAPQEESRGEPGEPSRGHEFRGAPGDPTYCGICADPETSHGAPEEAPSPAPDDLRAGQIMYNALGSVRDYLNSHHYQTSGPMQEEIEEIKAGREAWEKRQGPMRVFKLDGSALTKFDQVAPMEVQAPSDTLEVIGYEKDGVIHITNRKAQPRSNLPRGEALGETLKVPDPKVDPEDVALMEGLFGILPADEVEEAQAAWSRIKSAVSREGGAKP